MLSLRNYILLVFQNIALLCIRYDVVMPDFSGKFVFRELGFLRTWVLKFSLDDWDKYKEQKFKHEIRSCFKLHISCLPSLNLSFLYHCSHGGADVVITHYEKSKVNKIKQQKIIIDKSSEHFCCANKSCDELVLLILKF